MKRNLRSLLSAALIVCLLAGCAAGLSGCSSSSTLFTVDGNAVTEGYFAFYMYNYLSVLSGDLGENMPSSTDQISESQTVGTYVKDLIYKRVLDDYATIALGEEIGVKKNSTDVTNGKAYRENFIAQFEAAGTTYKQLLKSLNATDADIVAFCENVSLLARIDEALHAETSSYYPSAQTVQSITDDFHANYICITYVIQSTTNTSGEVLSDAQLALSRENCEAARAAFLAGDDPAAVVKKYSEDASSREEPYTIYFTLDSITDETLLTAIRPMGIGDVSDVLEAENGLMVVMRLPLDDVQISALVSEYMDETIDARKTQLSDRQTVIRTAAYDAFDMAF